MVAEELLHRPDATAVLQEMRREGVAEGAAEYATWTMLSRGMLLAG
jgi:hypothetical protein